jgi:hypothetical protein
MSPDFKISEDTKFVISLDSQLNLISNFYVDKNEKVMEKEMNLRLVGVNEAVGTDVEISSADFDISNFYGKKNQKLVIPLNGDHF